MIFFSVATLYLCGEGPPQTVNVPGPEMSVTSPVPCCKHRQVISYPHTWDRESYFNCRGAISLSIRDNIWERLNVLQYQLLAWEVGRVVGRDTAFMP